MTNIVIDFNRPFDSKLFDRCIQNRLPKFITDAVLILDISDNPQTDFNSIVVTKSDQWYITRQTTSQLFHLLEDNLPISYILIKNIIRRFSKKHKKIPYCFGDFLYFPIYTSTSHHHWCAYHHCIGYKKVGNTIHLSFDQSLEIIFPYLYPTAISTLKSYDSLLKITKKIKQDLAIDSSHPTELSITKINQLLLPTYLEEINRISPYPLDIQTQKEVLKHFEG